VHKKRIPGERRPAPLAEIDAHLAASFPVIVKVDYSPQEEDVQDHWIVLIDKQGEDYLVQDPYPIRNEIKPVLLSATPYGKGARPQNVILDILLFEGPVQAPERTPATSSPRQDTPVPVPVRPQPAAQETRKPIPENALVVQSCFDQLALRKTPRIHKKNLKARLPRRSRLTVLEPQAGQESVESLRLAGSANEAGEQGYVAWLWSRWPERRLQLRRR
jgi:hypothetical protein